MGLGLFGKKKSKDLEIPALPGNKPSADTSSGNNANGLELPPLPPSNDAAPSVPKQDGLKVPELPSLDAIPTPETQNTDPANNNNNNTKNFEVPELDIPVKEQSAETTQKSAPVDDLSAPDSLDDLSFDDFDLESFPEEDSVQATETSVEQSFEPVEEKKKIPSNLGVDDPELNEKYTQQDKEEPIEETVVVDGPLFIKVAVFNNAVNAISYTKDTVEKGLANSGTIQDLNNNDIKSATEKLQHTVQQTKKKILMVEQILFK
ncbi:MAG: hypothetical protein ACMXYK_04455 [Candidatus Woesearchaeota archaeon]